MGRLVGGLVLAAVVMATAGCGFRRKIDGPKIWWDDQAREQLPDNYELPADRRQGTERDPERSTFDTFGMDAY